MGEEQIRLEGKLLVTLPCEVCMEQAAAVVTDVVVMGEQGDQLLGVHSRHCFCAEHRRPPTLYQMDGSEIVVLEMKQKPRFIGGA